MLGAPRSLSDCLSGVRQHLLLSWLANIVEEIQPWSRSLSCVNGLCISVV